MTLGVLPERFFGRAAELKSRYPNPRSALIMLLHEAQDEIGYLSHDAMRDVATLMELDPADVAGVATFYTMFKSRHPGRFLISLCTNISCTINGAEQTAKVLREEVGPDGEPTDDGLCSWEHVECLAYCSVAPAAQLNYRDIAKLTPDRARSLVAALKAGRSLDDVVQEFGPDA